MTEDADSLTIYKSENSKTDTQLHFRFFGDDPEIATNIQYENRVLQ